MLNLLCIGALLSSGFISITEDYWERQLLMHGKMNLPVDLVVQSQLTSCGEAAIVMAHNYVYPETRLDEHAVIRYAVNNGYYNESTYPFTSPENMFKIAEHYTNNVSTGRVENPDEALDLLTTALIGGNPVIIDVVTLLGKPRSGAHFIVVTGLKLDPDNPNATRIYYNDPQLNRKRSSDWMGKEGIWNAWQNNGDPGGSGWWMMIYSP